MNKSLIESIRKIRPDMAEYVESLPPESVYERAKEVCELFFWDEHPSFSFEEWEALDIAVLRVGISYNDRHQGETVEISTDTYKSPYYTCPKCSCGNITRAFSRCIDCGVSLKWVKG